MQVFEKTERIVFGAVVDKNPFKVYLSAKLFGHAAYGREEKWERFLFVITGNHNGEKRHHAVPFCRIYYNCTAQKGETSNKKGRMADAFVPAGWLA